MNINDVVDYLCNLSPLQIISLTKELEDKWGVKAVPLVSTQAPTIKDDKKDDVATEVNVILISVPMDKKISVIKCLREVINLGLKECKDVVDNLPKVLKESVFREEAELIASKLTEAGAVMEIK